MILKILLVFCSAFIVNIFWAFYIKYAAEKKMLKAAIFGELILIAGAGITYNYINNLWMIVPAVIGGFFGTYYSHKIKNFFGLKD